MQLLKALLEEQETKAQKKHKGESHDRLRHIQKDASRIRNGSALKEKKKEHKNTRKNHRKSLGMKKKLFNYFYINIFFSNNQWKCQSFDKERINKHID
eukprot:UN28163